MVISALRCPSRTTPGLLLACWVKQRWSYHHLKSYCHSATASYGDWRYIYLKETYTSSLMSTFFSSLHFLLSRFKKSHKIWRQITTFPENIVPFSTVALSSMSLLRSSPLLKIPWPDDSTPLTQIIFNKYALNWPHDACLWFRRWTPTLICWFCLFNGTFVSSVCVETWFSCRRVR